MELKELELLNIVLEDDDTEFGGTSHSDERLAEIVEEALQENTYGMMDKMNEILKDSGIKTIDPRNI